MMQALRRYYRGATLAGMVDVATGERRNYFFDHQGTVQCLTDMQGNVTDRFASDAWGVPVKRTGTSINRQWYVGNLGYYRQVDQALDYVRARWLDNGQASWLSRDIHPRQLSYAYGGQRPSWATDPTGWWCEAPPENCCTKAVEKAKEDKTGCPAGVWTGCLGSKDPGLAGSCYTKGNCGVILQALMDVSKSCSNFCSGEGYGPGFRADAKAVCCAQPGKEGKPPTVVGCAVLCCYDSGTTGIPRKDPCLALCLYEHERRHLERCVSKEDPGDRPGDECDPYCGQAKCLLEAARRRKCNVPAFLDSLVEDCLEAHRRRNGGRDCPRSAPPRPKKQTPPRDQRMGGR